MTWATNVVEADPAAISVDLVWEPLWAELARLVDQFRTALVPHLGSLPLDARRVSPRFGERAAVVRLGPTELRFECLGTAVPPRPGEPVFEAGFGESRPLVRVFVLRDEEHVESVLAIDPERGVWASIGPETEPTPLDDRAGLERFLLGTLAA